MSQYDNTNTGIIAKNDRKTEDKHPDLKGSLNVEGREYWVSGWRKTRNSDGSPFYSLRLTAKDDNKPQPAPRQPAAINDDDDIPF